MKRMNTLKNCFGILVIITSIDCAKIIGIFNYPSKSHHILGETLLKALADKGHEVTMVSSFSSKTSTKNYNEIVIKEVLQVKEDVISQLTLDLTDASFLTKLIKFMDLLKAMEEVFFNHIQIQNLIKSKRKYDLAIVMWFGNDAVLALAEHVAKHTIVFSTVGSNADITKLTRAPAPPSYVPNMYPTFPDTMTFIQRLQNSLASIMQGFYQCFSSYQQKTVIEKFLPESPSTDALYEHVSLVLLNTHFSLESPRPYVPQMVQVGGLQLQEAKELTEEWKTFMDNAKDGAILFSLGANVKSSDLSKEKLESITGCFSSLSYKVLWKFENNNIPNLPKNVKVSNWLPQRDLLAHKNMKLFITHGGLLSTTEAVYHGVPMIGMPIFGDQDGNVNDGVAKGYTVRVSYSDLTEETLCSAIIEVINNPKYRNSIQERSRVFKDQELKPLDKALYWVEYVLRHDGAHHLKTSAFKLNWFQQYLLDVIILVLMAICVCIYVVRKIVKCVCSFVCGKSQKASKNKNRKLKTK